MTEIEIKEDDFPKLIKLLKKQEETGQQFDNVKIIQAIRSDKIAIVEKTKNILEEILLKIIQMYEESTEQQINNIKVIRGVQNKIVK